MADKNKNNYLYIGIALVVVIVLAIIFLSNSNNNSQNEVTCNSPYIEVGTSCCLDQNNNRICDNEEQSVQNQQAQQQEKSITSFSSAFNKEIELNSKVWAKEKQKNTFCKDLKDSIFAIVHVNRETKTIECEWRNRFDFVDAGREKNNDSISGASLSAEELTKLLDSCDSNTYEEYDKALRTSDWMSSNTNVFIVSSDAVPSTNVYVVHMACYNWDVSHKEIDIQTFYYDVLDANNGKSLID